MLKHILAYILPMKLIGYEFTDVVSGKPVCRWQEQITGRIVLAKGPMSWFRIEVSDD